MNKQPFFSIIIPIYNVEKFLCFCLESVINQTILDIEIICVNDGSTDNSLSIVRRFAEIDNRIVIIDKRNEGLSSARNVGLDVASGEYILFVDSDDMLNEKACEVLYRELLERKSELVVFGTEIFPRFNDCIEEKKLESSLIVNRKYYKNDSITALFSEKASKPFVWNECYKREVLLSNKLKFDEEVFFGEDMVFLFELFPKVTTVSYIPNKLYKYRYFRDGSLMSNSHNNKIWRINSHILIVKKIFEYWNCNLLLEGNENNLYQWSLNFFYYDLIDETIDIYFRQSVFRQLMQIYERYGLICVKEKSKIKRIQKLLR